MGARAVKIFDTKVSAGMYANSKNRRARKYYYVVRKTFGKNEYGVFRVRG